MSCDHLVGLYSSHWPGADAELLPASRVDATADLELEANARWLARGTGVPGAVARVKAITTRAQALAPYLYQFAYCPRCGAKLEPVLDPIAVDYNPDPRA